MHLPFIFGCFDGMFKDLAPVFSFISSSHFWFSHHGANTIFLSLIAFLKLFILSAFDIFFLRRASAFLYRLLCISSNVLSICLVKLVSFTFSFCNVSLLKTVTVFSFKSLGPISILIGIPFNSHSLNFQPGVYSSLSSKIGLNFSSFFDNSLDNFSIFSFESMGIGTITILFSANLGGITSPLSSL